MTKRDQPFVCLDVLAAMVANPEEPQSVFDLICKTGANEQTIRNGLKALGAAGLVEKLEPAERRGSNEKGVGHHLFATKVKKGG